MGARVHCSCHGAHCSVSIVNNEVNDVDKRGECRVRVFGRLGWTEVNVIDWLIARDTRSRIGCQLRHAARGIRFTTQFKASCPI